MGNSFGGPGINLPNQGFNRTGYNTPSFSTDSYSMNNQSNNGFNNNKSFNTDNYSGNVVNNFSSHNPTETYTSLDGRKWETKDQMFRANQDYYRKMNE